MLDLQPNTGMANLGCRTRLRAISAVLPDTARVMWERAMGSTPQMYPYMRTCLVDDMSLQWVWYVTSYEYIKARTTSTATVAATPYVFWGSS